MNAFRHSQTVVSSFAALAIAFTACGTTAGVTLPPRAEREVDVHGIPEDVRADFATASSRWSRRTELYEAIDARLFFAATLLTPEFSSALARRDQFVGSDSAPEIPASSDCAPSAFLGTYFHDPKLDDLAHRKSIWTIRLSTPQGEFIPVRIRRLARPDRRLRASFPFLDRFWVGYAVTFAPTESSASASECPPIEWNKAVLTMKSVVGATSLDFASSDEAKLKSE